MPIPSSGPISMSMFNTELGITSNLANSMLSGNTSASLGPAFRSQFWLGGQSGSLNQKSPHSMSEWYNYSGSTPVLTPSIYFDFANGTSWSGGVRTAINLGSAGSTYDAEIVNSTASFATASCSAPNYCGALRSNTAAYLLMTGSIVYSNSDFTWILYHYMETIPTSQLGGLIWSEDSGAKNFLWGYRNVGNFTSPNNPTYARIDTPSQVYQSPSAGTQFNGLGGTGGYLQLWHKTIATVLIKSGSSFIQYYQEPTGSLTKVWDVTINNWSITNNTVKIAIGAKNDGTFPNDQYLHTVQMYTQSLTETQVSQSVYTQLSKIVGGYCC